MNRLISLTILSIAPLLLIILPMAYAEDELSTDKNGYFISGYDPVSYFDNNHKMGSPDYSLVHNGTTILFSNLNNKVAFKQNPENYLPEYGGYCAIGVRMGKKFNTDPDQFAFEDDKLYFLLGNLTKTVWDKNRSRNIKLADRQWSTIETVSVKKLEE